MTPRSLSMIAAAMAVGVSAAYLLTHQPAVARGGATSGISRESKAPHPPPSTKKQREAKRQSAMFAAMSSAAAAAPPRTAGNQPAEPWESALYNIYERESEPGKIAEHLSSLLPELPPEGQAEAARYLVAVLDTTNYLLAVNPWQDPRLGQAARNVLMDDLGQRPPEVSGPIWAASAAMPSHPLHATAVTRRAEPEPPPNTPADPK